MGVAAQPALEEVLQFSDGNTCFGNLNLDVVAPVVRIGLRRAGKSVASCITASLSSIWLATTWPDKPFVVMSNGTAKGSITKPLLCTASQTIRPTPVAAAMPTDKVATRRSTPSHFSNMSR